MIKGCTIFKGWEYHHKPDKYDLQQLIKKFIEEEKKEAAKEGQGYGEEFFYPIIDLNYTYKIVKLVQKSCKICYAIVERTNKVGDKDEILVALETTVENDSGYVHRQYLVAIYMYTMNEKPELFESCPKSLIKAIK